MSAETKEPEFKDLLIANEISWVEGWMELQPLYENLLLSQGSMNEDIKDVVDFFLCIPQSVSVMPLHFKLRVVEYTHSLYVAFEIVDSLRNHVNALPGLLSDGLRIDVQKTHAALRQKLSRAHGWPSMEEIYAHRKSIDFDLEYEEFEKRKTLARDLGKDYAREIARCAQLHLRAVQELNQQLTEKVYPILHTFLFDSNDSRFHVLLLNGGYLIGVQSMEEEARKLLAKEGSPNSEHQMGQLRAFHKASQQMWSRLSPFSYYIAKFRSFVEAKEFEIVVDHKRSEEHINILVTSTVYYNSIHGPKQPPAM